MIEVRNLIIIGTDTGVGKTHVTALLAKKHQESGLKCLPFKPVESGGDDAKYLAEAANVDENDVSFYKFKKPMSPHLAAKDEGREIILKNIIDRFNQLKNKYDTIIVEGVGGLMTPLNEAETFADLAQALKIPVIIVTHPNLGTLNHTLLTVEACKQKTIEIAGLIVNRYPDNPDEVQENNLRELEKLTGIKPIPTPSLPLKERVKHLTKTHTAIPTPSLPLKGREYIEAIEADEKYVWHPFTPMQQYLAEEPHPLMIVEADGCCLKDSDGKSYIDGVSSLWINVHGHRKKELDEAIKNQLSKVAHSTLLGLSNEPAALLAKKLVDITPASLSKVFYSDSGSTAVEIAIKVAFQYFKQTGQEQKKEFVSFKNAYHGDTIGSVSVGGMDLFHSIFKELLFDSHQVSATDYTELETLLNQRGDKIAAVIIEPLVQGAAGIIVQPAGFLKKVEQLCKKYNVLLIADEVATGFGRTGKMFACQHENVQPDIMAVAKGITGGYLPLAATLFSEKIYNAFLGSPDELKTFFHGHTYTGNPLACAVALANIELFKQKNFFGDLNEKIKYLSDLLKPLAGNNHVAEIRQCGLMVGIELKDTDQQIERKVILKARQKGIIIRPLGNVVVLMPPLAISKDELKKLVEVTKWAICNVRCET